MKKLLKKLSLLLGLTLLSYGAIGQRAALAASFRLSFYEVQGSSNSGSGYYSLVGEGMFSVDDTPLTNFLPPNISTPIQAPQGTGIYFLYNAFRRVDSFTATIYGSPWTKANAGISNGRIYGDLLWAGDVCASSMFPQTCPHVGNALFSIVAFDQVPFDPFNPISNPYLSSSWSFKNTLNGATLSISSHSLFNPFGMHSWMYFFHEPQQQIVSSGYVISEPVVSPSPSPNNSAIPEPTTILGLILAGGGLGLVRRSQPSSRKQS